MTARATQELLEALLAKAKSMKREYVEDRDRLNKEVTKLQGLQTRLLEVVDNINEIDSEIAEIERRLAVARDR